MNDPTLWKIWKCNRTVHAQPCWHGRCQCGWATAFDFTRAEVECYLTGHPCSLTIGGVTANDDW